MIDRQQRIRRGIFVLAACAALWAPLGQPSVAALERPPLVELPLGHVRLYRLD
jgi:hypothetical protein